MEAPVDRHGKRKRKRSFLQTAKKHGKKGKFGRGTHVSEDVYQYFVRIMEMSRQEFESEEDKAVFVNNAFDETVGEEVNLSSNQLVSRAIENLLPFASDEVIDRFTEAFNKDLRPIFGDPFASHVLQKLLLIIAKRTKESLKKETHTDNETVNRNKEDWVIKIGRFGLNNMEDFAWDTYANHVLRTVLLCISGGEESENVKAGKGGALIPSLVTDDSKSDLPKDHYGLLDEYMERLASWPQLADLAFEGLTSGLLQSLQFALKRAGKAGMCDNLTKILIKDCFKTYGSDKRTLFENEYALHVLDSSLATASPEIFKQIYESCLKGKICELAIDFKANFSVQRLFDFCPDRDMLGDILAEIVDVENGMENIFSSGCFGVLSSIAKACKTHAHKQGVFMQNFMRTLGCYQTADQHILLVPLAVRMKKCDEVFQSETKEKLKSAEKLNINLHGSLILQAMLNFNKPIKVVNSMLEMSPLDLQEIFCDPKGSHIMDAFMTSIYVGAKSRERLIKKLDRTFVTMAMSKHGSRSLDAAWDAAGLKQRQSIVSELSARESQVTSSQFGRIVAVKTALALFRRNVEDWVEYQSGQQKKRELFADIIGKEYKCDVSTKAVKEELT